MIAKEGNFDSASNWRPIAKLSIIYKVFSKLIYGRIAPTLFLTQSRGQYGFTPDIRIEDALLCAEIVINNSQELNLPLWF